MPETSGDCIHKGGFHSLDPLVIFALLTEKPYQDMDRGGEPLSSRACNAALRNVKSASIQCAVRLNTNSGRWSELQMSVVKLTAFAFSTCAAIHF